MNQNDQNNKQDIFYLFETQVSNGYKFGMTSRTWEDRKKGYSGFNTPSKVITTYQIDSGSLEEHYFKMFLKIRNIPIVYGDEFFKFEGGIDILLLDFKNMDRTEQPTFLEYNKEKMKTLTTINYYKHKNKTKYKCSMCNFIAGHSQHLIYHQQSQHGKTTYKVRDGNKTSIYQKYLKTDRYKCEICDKRHGNKSCLTSHLGSKKHKKQHEILNSFARMVRYWYENKQDESTDESMNELSSSMSDLTMEEDTTQPNTDDEYIPESSEDESMDSYGNDLIITDDISPYEKDRMMIGDVMDYEEDEIIYI